MGDEPSGLRDHGSRVGDESKVSRSSGKRVERGARREVEERWLERS